MSFVRPALLAGVAVGLGIAPGGARAEAPPPAPAPAADPTPLAAERARDTERPLLVRPFFAITGLNLESPVVALHGDLTTSFGASVGWRRLKLSVSKSVKLVEDEPYEDGTTLPTSALALELSGGVTVGNRELVLTPFFSRYSGFQVETDPGVESGSHGGSIVPRADLRLQSFGVDALYCLNPNFSYDDRFNELKPREHSSGSFLLRSSLGRVSLASDGRALKTGTFWESEGPLARTTAFDANYAEVSVGAAGQWLPLSHFAINGMFTAGGTLANARTTLADGTRASQVSLKPAFSSSFGIGWVGYLIHTGFIYHWARDGIAIGDDTVTALRVSLLLYLGLRV